MAQRTRQAILLDLLGLAAPVSQLRSELAGFPWDSDELVTFTTTDALGVLDRCLNGQISLAELGAWVRAMEARDDIGLDMSRRDDLREFLFELSHPEINSPLTLALLRVWRDRLISERA
jgi:hypothetical protein